MSRKNSAYDRRRDALYELLTSSDIVGLPVIFTDGLVYIVGSGFFYDGEAISREMAYPMLRKRWRWDADIIVRMRPGPYKVLRDDNPRDVALRWSLEAFVRGELAS